MFVVVFANGKNLAETKRKSLNCYLLNSNLLVIVRKLNCFIVFLLFIIIKQKYKGIIGITQKFSK
jgi:hypothetical protein